MTIRLEPNVKADANHLLHTTFSIRNVRFKKRKELIKHKVNKQYKPLNKDLISMFYIRCQAQLKMKKIKEYSDFVIDLLTFKDHKTENRLNEIAWGIITWVNLSVLSLQIFLIVT